MTAFNGSPLRFLACGGAATVTLLASLDLPQADAHAQKPAAPSAAVRSAGCEGARDLALRGGKIVTLATPAIVSEVVIRDGRVVHVGPGGRAGYTPCTRVIDLKGRTAIPGLIDGHIHFVTWGFRPGRDVRLDLADGLADVRRAIGERARGVPSGEWITAVGGWSRTQFAENRLPTRAELDAAAPANPVFLWERDGQPAVVNTRGAQFLAARGIAAAADGTIAAAAGQAAIAYSALARTQTDPERGTAEALAHLATLGVTTVSDMGVNAAPEGNRPPERSWHSGHVDVDTAYDPVLALARADRLTARVRISFMDTPDGPPHDAQRLRYQFPLFGNDMIKTLCMGEFITPDAAKYPEAALAVARRGGWCHEQHVMGRAEIDKFVAAWEQVDAKVPLAGRHWRLAHVFGIDDDALARLKALDAGVDIAAMLYATGNQLPGPSREIRYRSIVASGVPVGGVSDGPNYMPIDPWVHIALMVRGTDSLGRRVVAPDQTLSRMQALALYTRNNAWFMADDRFGSIRPKAFGDIVVLDRDYLTVPDDQIRRIHAAMTIVDGKVIYGDLAPGRAGRSHTPGTN
ncbi:amidohydrolase [uncultured Sphingomonas sp.]|uniref:amidohydrolase n=1 Tax=uncultured Sphingomonas sp. TaxID=158754 RepID=UPI0035C9E089